MNGPHSRQVIVVTGASSGIGRAVARALAMRGAKLGLIARNEEALAAIADEVRRAGGEALVLPLEVADAAAVERERRRSKSDGGTSTSGSTTRWPRCLPWWRRRRQRSTAA